MPYTIVDGFPGGVDRSRPIHAAKPGTLWTARNCHINRGGDAEQRKAFVKKYDLPPGTFGLLRDGASPLVFSSALVAPPAGVSVQRLQHPDGYSMTDVLSVDLFDGKAYVVAKFSDGSVMHFYDGALVGAWHDGVARSAMTNVQGIATHLAALIDADAAYTAAAVGNVITITAAVAGTPFTIASYVQNVDGGTDDQVIALSEVVANVAAVPETLASASFRISAGTLSAGVNKVSAVKINGIEILGAAVDWGTSHTATAQAVATAINSYGSTPEYTATATGSTVVIKPAAGTGATVNGFILAVTAAGDVVADSLTNMAGGVDAIPGVAQTWTATVSGTFEAGDRYGLKLNGVNFGAEAKPYPVGTVVRTHGRKVYAGGQRVVNFSGVDTPIGWDRDAYAGAGFLAVSNHETNAETVTALCQYLNYLAIFFENATQVWFVDKDDSLNTLQQHVGEVGTIAPKTCRNYGNLDLFFLSPSGVRSIRSRQQVNLAGVDDVGTPIDEMVQEALADMTDDEIRACPSIVEPTTGRYWVAVGDKVFVFSYYQKNRVSGWGWYEPGVTFTDFVVIDRRVWCRAGDALYLYGGDDGETYDEIDVEVRLPFYAMGKPGHKKGLTALDIASSGDWDLRVYVNPNDPDADYVDVGEVSGVTFGEEVAQAVGVSTHFSMSMTRRAASKGVVSTAATYYFMDEQEV